ncbi:hypothetical protein HUJ04_011197 [Dendroctonus ponderosae]|nr:hypothetical protein HUJ04_011197 [Dendroctonus ponderosae]
MSGFRVAGIYPLNRDIFTEADFLPSYVTDCPIPPENNNIQQEMHNTKKNSASSSNQEAIGVTFLKATIPEVDALKAIEPKTSVSEITASCSTSATTVLSPEDIRPFPKASERKRKNGGRKKGKSAILTDSPIKDEIAASKLPKAKQVKKKVFGKTVSDDKKETFCIVCHGPYSSSIVDWLQCIRCKFWAHENCTDGNPFYKCLNCDSDDYY